MQMKIVQNSATLLRMGLCLLLVMLVGCNKQAAAPAQEGDSDMAIQIASSAFREGDKIPAVYTCDDKNISPPLAWTGVPENASSLALIMDDPDAPAGTWVHWVLFNLKPDLKELQQGDSGGGIEGTNDFNRMGYGGPCPPRGSIHRYYLKLYALDIQVDLKEGTTKTKLENAMRGHILAQGQLTAKYER